MINYIRAEIYRILHKKGLYIFFGALALLYIVFVLIRSGDIKSTSIVTDATYVSSLLAMLAGGCLFAAIYTDDLGSKNLTTLIGFGLSKIKLVFAKLILMTLSGAVVFGLVPLFMYTVYASLGWPAAGSDLATVYILISKAFLATVAYAALAGIVVYGVQRATFAMVLYILLVSGIVSQLITQLLMLMASDIAPGIASHMVPGIAGRLSAGLTAGDSIIAPVAECLAYAVIAASLSALAFNKKEMEF
jgi:hypothetical protein